MKLLQIFLSRLSIEIIFKACDNAAGDVEFQAEPTGVVGGVAFDAAFFCAISHNFRTINEVLQVDRLL